jgi:hypothetical protein
MDNHETIIAILDAKRFHPNGDSNSFKLGYLMELLGSIADRHPYVAAELRDRLNSLQANDYILKGKK